MRATALSVTMFIGSGIGVGIGPLIVGVLSDMFSATLGSGEGLRAAILIGLSAGPIAALLFAAASRTLARDIERAP